MAEVVAEITKEARLRCEAIGHGALERVEALRVELEENPTLGRLAAVPGRPEIRTTLLEPQGERPGITVTYASDPAPPQPGTIRIVFVTPVLFTW
ncbi:hypothetical protein ACFXKW_23655 [Streptomyces sp. NPDC059193]|uniref:hypothetical protein n=1 Tax=Streptomyces sp. NPDC059193 TaxID=3346763 RepID=UPI00369E0068